MKIHMTIAFWTSILGITSLFYSMFFFNKPRLANFTLELAIPTRLAPQTLKIPQPLTKKFIAKDEENTEDHGGHEPNPWEGNQENL